MDDFAKSFFGIDNGSYVTVTYSFDDVVKALNAVMPYDWAGFLHAHLALAPKPPLEGITRGGYRLVYTDQESERDKSVDLRAQARQLLLFTGPGDRQEGQDLKCRVGQPRLQGRDGAGQ